MRGEHACLVCFVAGLWGSSPHARGTLSYSRFHSLCTGIIPACAGNTYDTLAQSSSARDHPRMRGEHCIMPNVIGSRMGSSPHARGTLRLTVVWPGETGIIPACAGNTISGRITSGKCGDHPRMRGEHVLALGELSNAQGSSPHARGTPDSIVSTEKLDGIIPACAGNT